MSPRLLWASAKSGFSSNARRQQAAASSSFPWSRKASPRLLCAAAYSGRSSSPGETGRPLRRAFAGPAAHFPSCCGLRHSRTAIPTPGDNRRPPRRAFPDPSGRCPGCHERRPDRRKTDGMANVLDGHFGPACLRGDDTQQMPRVGFIGLDSEDLPVDLFGSLEPPRLVVRGGYRQCLGNRGHGIYCGNETALPQRDSNGRRLKLPAQRRLDLREHAPPIPPLPLAEQSHRGIPGAVRTIQQPSPVGQQTATPPTPEPPKPPPDAARPCRR